MAKPEEDVRERIVTSRSDHRWAPSQTAPGDDEAPCETSAEGNCVGARV